MYVRGAGPPPFGFASAAPLQPHPPSAVRTLSTPRLPLDSTTDAAWLGPAVALTDASIASARSRDSCSSMMCFLSMNGFSRLLLLSSPAREDRPSVEDRGTSLAVATRSDPNTGGRPFHDVAQPDFLLEDEARGVAPGKAHLRRSRRRAEPRFLSFPHLRADCGCCVSRCHPPLTCRQDLIRRRGVEQRRHNAGAG